MPITVIDLFAGPGGLGEGFSSFKLDGKCFFKIKLSIEKDPVAHQTLELRAFYREFPGETPDEYYEYLRGKISREELFAEFPNEAQQAKAEAWCAELGKESEKEVRRRIETALGGEKNWILIGGPPCQAYSLLGRWRKNKENQNFDKDEKHFLYKEYLRVIADHKPPVFVMENVKGLLSTTVNQERIFDRIRKDLTHPLTALGLGKDEDLKYDFYPLTLTVGEAARIWKPEDFIIRAEDFGIPQARHRLIVVGIRSDWPKKRKEFLKKRSGTIPIEDVIGDLPRLRSGLSKELDSSELWQAAIREIADAKWLTNHKINDELFAAIINASKRVSSTLKRGSLFMEYSEKPKYASKWFVDSKLKGICNHETRSHIRADLHRYFYAAVFAKVNGRSPVLDDFPMALLPKHENVHDDKFGDRFRVQLKEKPSTTVVSHIAKDGHYYIHYDPTQCRSLTVREAARLQTFPDNYFFEGPRTEQYHQVGNAVPPLLAKQIAEIVADLFQ